MITPAPAQAVSRRRRLAFALAATLAATVWAAVQDDGAAVGPPPPETPARPARRADAPAPQAPSEAPAWPEPPTTGARPAWRDALPQGLAAWGPPPPPEIKPAAPPAPAPSAPPQPPAFPYQLIGRIDDGQAHALLSNRLRSFGVKAADVIDDTWRVDAIDDAGVTLTWLPGGNRKTLAFPSS